MVLLPMLKRFWAVLLPSFVFQVLVDQDRELAIQDLTCLSHANRERWMSLPTAQKLKGSKLHVRCFGVVGWDGLVMTELHPGNHGSLVSAAPQKK